MLLLTDLIRDCGQPFDIQGSLNGITISGIALDSRKVARGCLFAALKGEKTNGEQFISQAKQSGAVAVLCSPDAMVPDGITALRTTNPRKALAHLAAAFYKRQPAHMVAVTGTDGKSSTADFYRQFWHLMNQSSASIGTLGVLGGDGKLLIEGSHTTPDTVSLHEMLAELPAEYVCMEASSHGLDQYRLDGVKLEAAAFTNIARDHLDYHHTEAAYFAAKARLFVELLPEGKTAVLNQDDVKFSELLTVCKQRRHHIIGFGKNGTEFRIQKLELLPHGQKASLELFGKSYQLEIPLVGAFQTMNILAALGLVVGSGGDLEKALACIPKLAGVPGRLQKVADYRGAAVYIDYAHTPMALANILNTLRPHTQNKLHVVFGCGGDRDPGKRQQMGEIAVKLADRVVVTDDNPRSENPAAIRQAIMTAAKGAQEVTGRAEAIAAAMHDLQPGDVLVIAGKGHEKTQIIGTQILPFDDAQVAREVAG